MGACWFKQTASGRSLRDTYNHLRDEAENEYGHDSYNGTISTTHYCEDLTDQFKRSKKSLHEYIDMQMDKIQKWHCAAICIEEPKANTNKTKSQVEHIVTPGTKKWVLQYVIMGNGRNLGIYKTKGHAVNNARKYTENNQIPTHVIMRKHLETGTDIVAKITYKRSNTERPGRWVFFGWAAE